MKVIYYVGIQKDSTLHVKELCIIHTVHLIVD
jgi:hypothetical protein